MNDEKKPYIVQLKRNNEVILHLRGSTGSGGAIDLAWRKYYEACSRKYVEAGRKSASLNFDEDFQTYRHAGIEMFKSDAKVHQAYLQYSKLVCHQTHLAGNTYNGTDESIDHNSQQGRCVRAIQEIPDVFNDQEKFEAFIQKAEADKNSAPQSDEVASLQEPFCPWLDADSGTGASHPNNLTGLQIHCVIS
jgi:hypothetical protein